MTGKLWFVAEWDDALEHVVRVWDWRSWSQVPIPDRPETAVMVLATDELDAYARALRGDYITRGANYG